jgi:hypothetical protein
MCQSAAMEVIDISGLGKASCLLKCGSIHICSVRFHIAVNMPDGPDTLDCSNYHVYYRSQRLCHQATASFPDAKAANGRSVCERNGGKENAILAGLVEM